MRKWLVSTFAAMFAFLAFAPSTFALYYSDTLYYTSRAGTAHFGQSGNHKIVLNTACTTFGVAIDPQMAYLQRLINGSWTTVGHAQVKCDAGEVTDKKTFTKEYNRNLVNGGVYRVLFENPGANADIRMSYGLTYNE